MSESPKNDSSLSEARQHLSDTLAILCKKDLPQHRRVRLALERLSGWEISKLNAADKRFVERQLIAVNAILDRNRVQSAADYERMSRANLDAMEQAICEMDRRLSRVLQCAISD